MKTFTTYAEKKAKQFFNLLQGYTKGIRLTAILILLVMGVSNAWAYNVKSPHVYFNATNVSSWPGVNIVVGHDSYSFGDLMSKVSNTNLYYAKVTFNGSDANGFVFIGANSKWGEWNNQSLYDRTKNQSYRTDYLWFHNTITGGLPSGTYYFSTSGNKQAIDYSQYTTIPTFNTTSAVRVRTGTSGTYSDASGTYPANISIQGTYISENGKTDRTSITSTKSSDGDDKKVYGSVITGLVTLSYSNLNDAYTFDGWGTSNSNVSSTSTNHEFNQSAHTTVYAFFTKKTYTITYKQGANGSGSIDAGIKEHGVDYTLSSNKFTRTGYTQTGWSTSDGGAKVYDLGGTYTANTNVTLYPFWTPNQYTITYKDQGGSNFSGTHESGYPTTHTYGTTTTLKTASKTGYTFEGWYKESACTNKVTSLGATAYTANITLYAKWTPNTNTPYVVKHCKEDLNGNYPAELTDTQNLTGTTDSKVTPSVKSYTGFTAPSAQTVTIQADGNLVVTYKYTRNSYQLTWELEGGTIQTAGTTAGQVKYEAPLSAPTVTKEGHNFTSWDPIVPSTMPASDATYTAQWQKKSYTVAYGVVGAANGTIALNNETPAIKDQNKQDFEHGITLTFTATPADGYRVLEPQGWFSDEEGNTSLGNGTAKTYTINSLTDAASVFVAFEKIPASTYIVTFDANGGDNGTMNSQSFTENVPQNLTPNAFTRTGYTFSNWNTQADGTGDSYADGQSVTLTTAGLTLYAQWTAKQYTITLDKQGGTGGSNTVTVHYDNNDYSVNPVSVPSIQGYAFMGYYEKGSGFQVVDATGNWVKSAHGYTDDSGNWKKASDITLYAHFEKAQVSITLDKEIFESGTTEYVVASHTIAPTPAGTTKVCWDLCYSNGNPVAGHEPIEDGDEIKFPLEGLSAGSYKVVATLYLGNECGGEELSKAEATFVVAGSYTVTIKYTCDGEQIAASTAQEGHPTNLKEATAPEIGGYNFVKWVLGDGITSTSTLTNKTISYTANYDGYLTATYKKKDLIFLDISTLPNKAQWKAPHVYLYKEGGYWSEEKGTGSKSGGNFITDGAMTKVQGTTDIWCYEYAGVENFGGVVAFTSVGQSGYENFAKCEVIYRKDFTSGTPVFVPAAGQKAVERNKIDGQTAQYYSEGYWVRYMGRTGYSLLIYNEAGDTELMRQDFTSDNLRMSMKAIIDLEANHTYKYEVLRDNDYYYKNSGTLTTNNKGPVKLNSNDKGSIKTTESGNYVFVLDYVLEENEGDLQLSVVYPVASGDYHVLYKDDTRSTYKPSQIIKKDEAEPIVGYFVRPGKNPKFKVQSAARISDEGVTWYNSDNEIFFKPNNNWKSDGARFAAYFYNNSKNEWVDLKANGDLYSCVKPTTNAYTHVIFCRMDPKKATNNWSNNWDQTGHLKLTTENLYTLNEGEWGNKLYLKPNSNWTQGDAWFAAYFFETGKEEKWLGMSDEDGDGVYVCDIPAENHKKVIFVRMDQNKHELNWDSKWDQSADQTVPTNGNTLFTVKDGDWNNAGGSWSEREGSWSTISGSITDLTEELEKKLEEIKGDIKDAPDSVYTIHLEKNGDKFSVAKVVPYSGNFYIRVDAAAGKWYDYKTNPDNLMTYSAFSESDANSFGEKFSHYKTEWCSDGMNVKFVIANDYSPCISDTLVQDTENSLGNIDVYGNLKNEDKYNANIRFMWNRSTNKVSRAYVAAATDDAKKFLVLKTDKPIKNNKDQSVNEIIFQDTQNWIYEYTIKAKPGTRVKLYACYPDVDEAKAQYFRGKYNNPTTFDENNSVHILGGTGEAWNTIRVLYDFKTNRLMGAWVPESAISTEQAIAADLMVIRRHQENATCVTLTNENSKLTDVKTAYGAMQFNRWTINNRGGADDLDVEHCTKLSGSHRVYDETVTNQHHPVLQLAEQTSIYERGLYFISFPFDVHLSDVFGFGTYGTHWVISTYNGKRRAERGYFAEDCINEDCTNWDYIWDPSGFVMKANEGYLLSLDLDLMKHDNTDFWANNISQVELFFPSTAAVESIEKIDYTMPALGEEYLCKINHNTPDGDRRVKDSYWRCIGVPSFADYDGSLTTDGNNTINWKDDYTWEADKEVFPFLYEWNVTNNDLVVRSTNSYKFRATYAYLIQNGNEIHWSAVNTKKPTSIIARDQTENVSNFEWKIALLRNDAPADHTFIRMTDNESVTSAFDFHQDLSKEFNYGANIYTLVGYERLAANSLPMSDSTTIIPLGVSAQEAGDYTITMPEGVENIGITLVDNETGIHTNLSAGQEYTLTLNNGICENRLFIEVSPIQNTPTDLEYTTEDTREQTTRKMLIDGILYLIRDGVIYDAQGHRL